MIWYFNHTAAFRAMIVLAALCVASPMADGEVPGDDLTKINPNYDLIDALSFQHTNNPPNIWDDECFPVDPLRPEGDGPSLTELDPAPLVVMWELSIEPEFYNPPVLWKPRGVIADATEGNFAPTLDGSVPYAPAVPAPGAAALLGLGLLAVVGRRRRG
jgi:hypothetical protein